jgi:hypothetical protein
MSISQIYSTLTALQNEVNGATEYTPSTPSQWTSAAGSIPSQVSPALDSLMNLTSNYFNATGKSLNMQIINSTNTTLQQNTSQLSINYYITKVSHNLAKVRVFCNGVQSSISTNGGSGCLGLFLPYPKSNSVYENDGRFAPVSCWNQSSDVANNYSWFMIMGEPFVIQGNDFQGKDISKNYVFFCWMEGGNISSVGGVMHLMGSNDDPTYGSTNFDIGANPVFMSVDFDYFVDYPMTPNYIGFGLPTTF